MQKHMLAAAAALAFTTVTFDSVALAGASFDAVGSTRIATGLERPIGLAHAPGDDSRLFVIEKPGRIKIIDLDTENVLGTPFLNITSIVGGGTSFNDERGLLGLAFHPDYDNNGYFFVNYTNTAGNTTIRRYEVSGDPNVADPNSGLTLLTIGQPFANHNGGWLGFGPDGYLYIAVGDGGSGGDPQNNGQNPQNLLGTMLRIDVDNTGGGQNFAIPSDNPFVGDPSGLDEIWAYGLRNPWRNSFDRDTGDFYIADVGQNAWEEVNFQSASSPGGENYGWRCYEGNQPHNLTGCDDPATMEFPFHVYPISGTSNCAVTGGYVYRGSAIPAINGQYIFADYCSAQFWAVEYDGDNTDEPTNITSQLSPTIEGHNISWVSSFGEDANGEMYIVSQPISATAGAVYKIISTVPSNDTCEEAIAVGDDEEVQFDTTGASTTGPDEPDDCDIAGDTQIGADIWFVHEATCTGDLTVETCGSSYTTKLGVYGGSCPTGSGEILACDLVSCPDNRSQVTISVTQGQQYYIRIGGRNAATGEGVLNISCEPGKEPKPCPGDIDDSGEVNVDDLLIVLNNWGVCDDPGNCPGDVDESGEVNVDDLLIVLNNWGVCP